MESLWNKYHKHWQSCFINLSLERNLGFLLRECSCFLWGPPGTGSWCNAAEYHSIHSFCNDISSLPIDDIQVCTHKIQVIQCTPNHIFNWFPSSRMRCSCSQLLRNEECSYTSRMGGCLQTGNLKEGLRICVDNHLDGSFHCNPVNEV